MTPATVRRTRLAYLGVALVPSLGALFATALGCAANPMLLVAVGGCVSACYLLQYRAYRVLNRYLALGRLAPELLVTGLGIGLAALFGGVLARFWQANPGLSGKAFWLAAALVLAHQALTPLAYGRQIKPLVVLLAGPARLLTDKGVFLFYAAGLFHPHAELLQLAGWLALLELPGCYAMFRSSRSPVWPARVNDAHYLIDAEPPHRDEIRAAWLADSVLGRGDRVPDLSLVHTMADQAQRSVQRTENQVLRLMGLDATSSRSGQAALGWVEMADGLIAAAEQALGPAAVHPPTARALDLAKAHCAQARADIWFVLGRREEALLSWRAALDLRMRHGLRNLCAKDMVTLASGQGGQALQLMTAEDAVAELDRLMGDETLTPLARRHAMLASALCRRLTGQDEQAAALAAAARRLPVRRADMRCLSRERVAAGLRPLPMFVQRQLDLGLILWTSTALVPDPFGPSDYLLIATRFWPGSRARELVINGMRLWQRGRTALAESTLRQAARVLTDEHQPLLAYWVLLQLGRAQYDRDPAGAYRNLMDALALYESLRGRVLDVRLRMHAGGSAEGMYTVLVRLLADTAPGEKGDGWPERPAASALELVERGRSRMLLELLGDTTPLRTAPEHAELVRDEEEARRMLAACLAAIDAAPGEEALIKLRQARAALDGVLSELAATGRLGEEYAQLRRGEPGSYAGIRALLAPGAAQ